MTPESRMLAVRAAQNFNLPEDRAAFYVDNQVRLKQREEAGRVVAEQMRAAGLKPEEDQPTMLDKIKAWSGTLFSAGESLDERESLVPTMPPPVMQQVVVEPVREVVKEEPPKAEGKGAWGTVKGWIGR